MENALQREVTREQVLGTDCRYCGARAGNLCFDRERGFNQRLWDPHGLRVIDYWRRAIKNAPAYDKSKPMVTWTE